MRNKFFVNYAQRTINSVDYTYAKAMETYNIMIVFQESYKDLLKSPNTIANVDGSYTVYCGLKINPIKEYDAVVELIGVLETLYNIYTSTEV